MAHYGGYTGDFDSARSSATSAYEGRRRDSFTEEFIASSKMMDRGVPRSKSVGSWAGAFGNPQFSPSVYSRVAQDADGDGSADIWSSRADTSASIGNYFRDAGWRPGEPWGLAVSVPDGLDRAASGTASASPRCPQVFARHSRWKTMREWRASGSAPKSGVWPGDDVSASSSEPDGRGRTAYSLTGNYRVILDYNCSNFYALRFASATAMIAVTALAFSAPVMGEMASAKAQPVEDRAGPAGDYPMVSGAPFMVDGVTYTPADTMNYDAVGYAGEDGGEGISGAHRTSPSPSYVE
ncbi:hypothetical protein OY671_008080, partial [Metschnikowia pulcherrima]